MGERRKSRLRWWVASQLNRMPGQCWADLVTWALRWKFEARHPWRPVTGTCREDAARTGACYCGKVRAVNRDG